MIYISKDTFKKIFLLYMLTQVEKGIYGEYHFLKFIFLLERQSPIRPFTFKLYFEGSYSEDMIRTKDLLLQTHWITAKDVGKTLAYQAKLPNETKNIIKSIIENFPELHTSIQEFIKTHAYKTNIKLRKEMYETPEIRKAGFNEVILEENLPERIKITNLKDEDIEDLQLGMDSNFLKDLECRMSLTGKSPHDEWRTVLANL